MTVVVERGRPSTPAPNEQADLRAHCQAVSELKRHRAEMPQRDLAHLAALYADRVAETRRRLEAAASRAEKFARPAPKPVKLSEFLKVARDERPREVQAAEVLQQIEARSPEEVAERAAAWERTASALRASWQPRRLPR